MPQNDLNPTLHRDGKPVPNEQEGGRIVRLEEMPGVASSKRIVAPGCTISYRGVLYQSGAPIMLTPEEASFRQRRREVVLPPDADAPAQQPAAANSASEA